MSFLGKDYKFVKEENFEEFLKAAGIPEEQISKILDYKPSFRMDLDGDTYTSTTINGDDVSKISFKSGVEFEDTFQGKTPYKSTITIDGNIATQVIHSKLGTYTFHREYNGNDLLVTITGPKFDGVAKRWYKA